MEEGMIVCVCVLEIMRSGIGSYFTGSLLISFHTGLMRSQSAVRGHLDSSNSCLYKSKLLS